ncbi:MAG TPA: hypothetical protein ENK09_01630 [Nitrospirae bacterium]|nr:hypothetical protein [Nitrospirota bacterium]
MKRLLVGLFVSVLFITFLSIYQAGRHYDGLVAENYYPKAERFFRDIKRERELGLEIGGTPFRKGMNRYRVKLSTRKGKLTGARLLIKLRMLSENKYSHYLLKEVSPGEYEATFRLPEGGYYLFVLQLSHPALKTEKRWFQMVE